MSQYRQSAKPFIVFPLDNSLEGWIQVATDLQTMINYLIEQKTEKVVVRYIDRRTPDGEIEYQWDYGLAVEAYREEISEAQFKKELDAAIGNNGE
jgi:hypothetical protein